MMLEKNINYCLLDSFNFLVCKQNSNNINYIKQKTNKNYELLRYKNKMIIDIICLLLFLYVKNKE